MKLLYRKIKILLESYWEFLLSTKSSRGAFYALIPIIAPAFFVFLLLLYTLSNWDEKENYLRNKLSNNSIIVENVGFDKNNIVIKWTSDDTFDTITIYEAGKITSLDFKSQGYNTFFILVNDSLIYTEKQFKKAYWKGYDYKFIINKVSNKYQAELKINE